MNIQKNPGELTFRDFTPSFGGIQASIYGAVIACLAAPVVEKGL